MDGLVLDHLIYAVPDLEAAVDDLGRRTGVRAAPGGSHPGRGTSNALLGLGAGAYLEILAPDPDQPPEGTRWLGADPSAGPRLSSWAVRTADLPGIARRAAAAGVRLGDVIAGSRRRADGTLLSWMLTDPRATAEDGIVPFFIDWGSSPHPSVSAPDGVTLAALRGEHPRPGDAATLLGNLGLELPVTKGERPALVAVLQTPKGLVELR
jgi:Glyoxalase-like domain